MHNRAAGPEASAASQTVQHWEAWKHLMTFSSLMHLACLANVRLQWSPSAQNADTSSITNTRIIT